MQRLSNSTYMALALVGVAGLIASVISGSFFDLFITDFISSDVISTAVLILTKGVGVWFGVMFMVKMHTPENRSEVFKKSLVYFSIWLLLTILISPKESFYYGYGYPKLSLLTGILRDACMLVVFYFAAKRYLIEKYQVIIDNLNMREDKGLLKTSLSGWFGWLNLAVIAAHLATAIVFAVLLALYFEEAQGVMVLFPGAIIAACISGLAIALNLTIFLVRKLKKIIYTRSEIKLAMLSVFFPFVVVLASPVLLIILPPITILLH